jgi:hypothetical protein
MLSFQASPEPPKLSVGFFGSSSDRLPMLIDAQCRSNVRHSRSLNIYRNGERLAVPSVLTNTTFRCGDRHAILIRLFSAFFEALGFEGSHGVVEGAQ